MFPQLPTLENEPPHPSQKRQRIGASDDPPQRTEPEEQRLAPRKDPHHTAGTPPLPSSTLLTSYTPYDDLHPPPLRQPIVRLPDRFNPTMSEVQLPLAMYDAADFAGLPANEDQNPHNHLTCQGAPPAELTPASKVFTEGVCPCPHVPTFKFFGNVDPAQKAGIQAKAATVLALVVHGGGQRFIARSPGKTTEIKTFIQSLKFVQPPPTNTPQDLSTGGPSRSSAEDMSMCDNETEDGEVRNRDGAEEPPEPAPPQPEDEAVMPLRVYAPVINKPNDKNRFGQPWTYFVDLPPTATTLREYLLWQKVFAVHTTLSFSVYPIMRERQPWTIMVLSGPPDAIVDTEEDRHVVLTEIKKKLWANKFFVYFVARLAARNWGINGSVAQLAKATTDTLDAKVVMAEDPSNGRATVPAYLITGKPPSDERDEYARWIEYYTAPGVFWIDNIYQLKVNKLVVECKICKDTTHCARDCALAKIPGWQGPSATDIYQPAQGVTPGQGLTMAAEPAEQAREIWQEVPRRGGARGARGGARGTRGARGARGGGRMEGRGGRGGQRR